MKNPLDSPWMTLGLGLILTVLLTLKAKWLITLGGPAPGDSPLSPTATLGMEYGLRWLHFLFGFTWIGLLYYFNLVQVPSMKLMGPEAKADLFKEGSLVRTALYFFRWAAVGTVLVGGLLMIFNRQGNFLLPALSLMGPFAGIGLGGWLGIIMMINVWVFIWPNQKKVLGIVEATPDEKTKGGRVALLASRTNFMLSVPMLWFMESASHGFATMVGSGG